MLINRTFRKVYYKIKQIYINLPKDTRITIFELFRFNYSTRLLFFRNSNSKERFYIPQKLITQVLRIGHKDHAYIETR